MSIINWSEHDGETFQVFCNDLLSFEFGRDYIPFSAPGKDHGIDGLFDGNYNGKKGKWRIQAKFRYPETGRSASIAYIKSQIKSDLERNVQDEKYVLFITNVEIGAIQYKEIITVAKESGRDVEFEIWDAAKINTLLTRHPIVKLWYSSDAKHLIEDYSTFYKDELQDDSNSLYTFSSTFYFREENLNELDLFIKSTDKIAAIISGVAGIGKTRLCIEYFERIQSSQNWIALVIISHKIDLQLLRTALQGERNYLLLVDDADKFEEKDIVDLLTIVRGIDNKIKVLFTVRSYFLEKVRNQFSPDDLEKRITQVSIQNLTPEETVHLLVKELDGNRIVEYIGYLANLTHGIPLIINALIRIVKSGTSLSEISKDSLLQHYINQLLDRFKKNLSEEHEIKRKSIDKLISLIALIEPIQLHDQNLINTISSTEDISIEEIEIVFDQLRSQKLISGHYEYSIKPDVYSDLILEKAIGSSKWINIKIKEYGEFINHIIKNIAYVEKEKHNLFFDKLLQEYVATIDQCSDKYALTRILDTVYLITYLKPALALNSITKVISIFENENHPLYDEFETNRQNKNYSLDSSFNNLKSILSNLIEIENYSKDTYYWSGKLYSHTHDEGVITSIARFSKSDKFNGFNCVLQERILELSKKELFGDRSPLKGFALKAINSILKLQFTDSESHPYQKNAIQIYTITLPQPEKSKEVNKLRKKSLEVLIEAFNKNEDDELRTEIIRMLVDVPREIFSIRDKNYKRNEEIAIVLDFLKILSTNSDLDLNQKHHIREQLYWYKRWGIEDKFNLVISEIETGLASNDLADILLEFLNPKYDSDLRRERDLFEEQAREIIISNTYEDLADALLKVTDQSEYAPPNFFPFLNVIASDINIARGFIDYLWGINKSFILNYCSGMLQKFRLSIDGLEFFWKYIDKIASEQTDISRNCILGIYNSRGFTEALHASKNRLEPYDINTIIGVFETSSKNNHFHLSYTLPILFSHNKETAYKQISLFLSQINERYLDNLFYSLDDYFEEYYDEIRDLVIKETIHLNITHGLERGLNRIIKRDGFDIVLDYFKSRFDYKKRLYQREKQNWFSYDFAPKHGSSISKDFDDDKKIELFKPVLKWFIGVEFEPLETLYAKDLISVFKPGNQVDKKIFELYQNLIREHELNGRILLSISKSLSEFKTKNSLYIDLVIEILMASGNLSNNEWMEKIRSQCYISLTSLGVKSGTQGQPFSVDLELEELLRETLAKSKAKNPAIMDFVQGVLRSVQADIESQTDKEGGELW